MKVLLALVKLLPKYPVFRGRQLLYLSAVVVSSARPYPPGIHRFCCGFSAATLVGNLDATVSSAYSVQRGDPHAEAVLSTICARTHQNVS